MLPIQRELGSLRTYAILASRLSEILVARVIKGYSSCHSLSCRNPTVLVNQTCRIPL